MAKDSPRFPRLEGVTPKVKLCEKLLRHTYNRLYKTRVVRFRSFGYDIYKEKKRGQRAPFFFTVLAIELCELKIDPSHYLKIMVQYGKFANVRWLPPPSWLASDDAIKAFEWLHKKERSKWQTEEDWERSLKGYRERDIFKAIKNSGSLVQQGRSTFTVGELEIIMTLLDELSPWFLASYLPSATRKVSEMLVSLLKSKPDVYQSVVTCILHFRNNVHTWKRAKETLKNVLA